MTAVISPDGLYRYELTRTWLADPNGRLVTFVMLNPSTADATINDPTIRRCLGFAVARYRADASTPINGIRVVNLYAWRSPHPSDLFQADDPIGPDNDRWLANAIAYAAQADAPLIAAWGARAPVERVWQVLNLHPQATWSCLGLTEHGHPRHPLYVKKDAQLQRFTWPPHRKD